MIAKTGVVSITESDIVVSGFEFVASGKLSASDEVLEWARKRLQEAKHV